MWSERLLEAFHCWFPHMVGEGSCQALLPGAMGTGTPTESQRAWTSLDQAVTLDHLKMLIPLPGAMLSLGVVMSFLPIPVAALSISGSEMLLPRCLDKPTMPSWLSSLQVYKLKSYPHKARDTGRQVEELLYIEWEYPHQGGSRETPAHSVLEKITT